MNKLLTIRIIFINFEKNSAYGHDAIKLELIQWQSLLEDDDTLNYLKVVEDSSETKSNWWKNLSDLQKGGIERGLNDIKAERIFSNSEVKSMAVKKIAN